MDAATSTLQVHRSHDVYREYILYFHTLYFTDNIMEGHIQEYELGKRHLANIMGKDPDDFTQKDIDVSIIWGFRQSKTQTSHISYKD